MKLRNQLFVLSLLTLALPWAGCEYIREMENTLRDGQEQSLLTTTRTIAHLLTYENPQLFNFDRLTDETNHSTDNTYAFRLNSQIQLDGYVDDWGQSDENFRSFRNQMTSAPNNQQPVSAIAATYKSYLYLFFSVKDDQVIYHRPSQQLVNGDRLQLLLRNKNGQPRRYFIQTSAPGKLEAQYLIDGDSLNPRLRYERRISGQWQDTATGYNIELRIPLKLLTSNINMAIVDIDTPSSDTINGWYGTWDKADSQSNGLLIQTSPKLETLLQRFNQDRARLSVADSQGWLLSSIGSIERPADSSQGLDLNETLLDILNQLYHFIMNVAESTTQAVSLQQGRIQGPLIEAALNKQEMTSWYKPETSNRAIVSASFPVIIDNRVVAVVVADQSSEAILSLTNRALSRLITLSSIAILIAAFALLGYATLLSFRIRKLRNAAEDMISADGQLSSDYRTSNSRDELGDLSRSMSTMHKRLQQYTLYLRSLASKLSHELRTPLAVVQSSLDNLSNADLSEQSRIYAQRAREGSDRLANIITAMSEATRVEQSIQASELEDFDLGQVLRSSIEAYRDIYPEHDFKLHIETTDTIINGSPELMVQLLDKLISNAVDFSPNDSDIQLNLNQDQRDLCLSLSNSGPLLPTDMQSQLFDSMVSLRRESTNSSHLGLGLYIAKLITQAHGGQISAHNRDDDSGVEFIIRLPLA